MILMFICFISVVLVFTYNPSDPNKIIFGESCPLTGNSKDLGLEYSSGIQQAFDEVNELGGIHGGKELVLDIRDDQYEPDQCASNTDSFIADNDIFALIGYVGTPTALAIEDRILDNEMPLIGPLTGASFLRTPFQELFVNIRASYDDEASAMIHYTIRKKFKMRYSVLYQDDGFGEACLDAVEGALVPYGKRILSKGSYIRNSVNVSQAYLDIAEGSPDVIFMAGTYQPLAEFVSLVQEDAENIYEKKENILFISFSFVGTTSFGKELTIRNVTKENIMVSEVVPNVEMDDTSDYPFLQDYLEYRKDRPDLNITFKSLEGYIVGKSLISFVVNMLGEEMNRTRLLEAIYSGKRFDVGGMLVGKFWDGCNQGLREVFPVSIIGNLNSTSFVTVEEAYYSWDECLAADTDNNLPALFLAQTCPLSGKNSWSGKAYENGIKCSGFEYIRGLETSERIVALDTLDDQSDPFSAAENVDFFLEQNRTFLIFGAMDIDNALRDVNISDPFVAPFCGSNRIREPVISANVINIRAGYDEEIGVIIQHAMELGKTRISVLYDNSTSSVGFECFSLVEEILTNVNMEIFSSAYFDPSNEEQSIQEATEEILYSYVDDSDIVLLPEVVIMFGKYEPISRFIKGVINEPQVQKQIQEQQEQEENDEADDNIMMIFATVSTVGTIPFLNELQNEMITESLVYENIWISQVVPNFNDSSIPIVSDYQFFMKELGVWEEYGGYVSLEGYIAGRFVTSVLSTFSNEELSNITSQVFLDRVYSLDTIFLGEEYDDRTLQIGPYNNDPDEDLFCNQGLRTQAWLTSLSNRQVSDITLDTSGSVTLSCRYDKIPKYPTFFGQTVEMNEKVRVYTTGIQLALEEHFGRTGTSILIMLDKDNKNNQTIENSHLMEFAQKSVMALVGGSEYDYYSIEEEDNVKSFLDDHDIIMIDPIKIGFGGNPEDSRVIHLRPYTIDEVYYANDYLYNELKKNLGVLFFSSEESQKYDLEEHLKLMDIQYITGSTENQIISSFPRDYFDVVMYLPDDDLHFLRDTLIPELLESPDYDTVESLPEFVFPSYIYGSDLKNLSETYDNKIRYSTISLFSRTSIPYDYFLKNYESEYFSDDNLDVNFGFHGYLVGKWIISNYMSSENHGETFFNNIHYQDSFDLENDVIIRFGGEECNVGIKTLLFYDHLGEELAVRNFGGKCTEYYEWQPEDIDNLEDDKVNVIGIILPFIIVLSLVPFCLCCSFLCIISYFLCCGLSCGVIFVIVIGAISTKNLKAKMDFQRQSKRLKKFEMHEDQFKLYRAREKMRDKTTKASFEEIRRILEEKGTLVEWSELEIDEDKTKVLGGGGSGAKIILVYWKKKKMWVAFKQFNLCDLVFKDDIRNEVLNEVHIMSSLNNEYILKYYGSVIDTRIQVVGHILEYCERGDLTAFLYSDKKKKNPGTILSVYEKLEKTFCISVAMEYLHENNIMHRDLKLENVLITNEGVVKVMDFGISREMDSTFMETQCGTNCYIAPEVTRGELYTQKCDIYSFGILMYLIFMEKSFPYDENVKQDPTKPFHDYRVAENPRYRPLFSVEHIENLEKVNRAPPIMVIELIKKCWDNDPNERFLFNEIKGLLASELEKIRMEEKDQMKSSLRGAHGTSSFRIYNSRSSKRNLSRKDEKKKKEGEEEVGNKVIVDSNTEKNDGKIEELLIKDIITLRNLLQKKDGEIEELKSENEKLKSGVSVEEF